MPESKSIAEIRKEYEDKIEELNKRYYGARSEDGRAAQRRLRS